ncbi:MAG: biopolymer transporter ExbD [Polyangiaceae bacterium]|nr:biopolymer transporter ExbD [Polyangiaceae bacterium]
MAGVDVESGGHKKRATNSDINMIPFIDLLMVTIAFLLITAVWTTSSRLNANAEMPGQAGCGEECQGQTAKVMHVHVNENDFQVIWKSGATTVTEQRIPRNGVEVKSDGSSFVRYPDLAKLIEQEWARMGEHKNAADRATDRAVIHTADQLPFKEVAAVLDAVNAPKREVSMNGTVQKVSAFAATFSVR